MKATRRSCGALRIVWVLLLICLTTSFSLPPCVTNHHSVSVLALQQEPTNADDKSRRSQEEEEVEFERLDLMLQRARKREIHPMLRLQALWSTPLLPITPFTRGDAAFTLLAALALHAPGFALGFLTAKLTASRLLPKGLPPVVVHFYPVLLALVCDQMIF